MSQTFKLTSIAIAATLLGASSALALERATTQLAQAEPEERGQRAAPEGGGGGGGEAAPRAREREGGERPARAKGADDGEGGPPAREKKSERPERKAAPSADEGEAPPAVKPPRVQKQERDDEPKARAPVEATEPQSEPKPKPKAVEKERPEPQAEVPEQAKPEPKPELKPEPKAEPELKPVPKAEKPPTPAEPGPAADDKALRKEKKAAEPKAEPDGVPPVAKEPPAAAKERPAAKDLPAAKEPPPGAKELPGGPKMPSPAEKGAERDRRGPPVEGGKAPAPAAKGEGAGTAAPSQVKDLKELKEERKERSEDGGKRIIIEEPDNRAIIKEGGKTIIRHDETERFRRLDRGKTRNEKRNGLDISISIRPGGVEIYTETDDRGRALRRYRRDRDGREVNLFDNRDYYRRHNDATFIDAVVDLPPPRISIPREEYVLDYEEASDVEIYETLSAPPVDSLDRTYSMEEVRRSPMLRDRMRRIDLDAINFEFGSFDVTSDQYPALQRVADAIRRVIDRNPNEIFLIEGHTDAVGSDEDNLSLSDRRAESVAIVLTEQFGVAPENMTTQGYGEQYLKVNTQQAERQNRRVAIRRITPLLSRN